MAPKFVTPYQLSGKKGKNDAADAAAICEAVTRPSMRFVPSKGPDRLTHARGLPTLPPPIWARRKAVANDLSAVRSFLYLITNSLQDSGVAQQIAGSAYDLVIASCNLDDPALASSVAAADPRQDKILVGYFDLTEAGPYMNRDLFAGPSLPDWFGKPNAQWSGLYSVQYWNDAWKAEVFHRMDQMIAAGFDGVFFDVAGGDNEWLPGNSFGNPATPDATEKLITLVSQIRNYIAGKNLGHPFYVIPNMPSGIAHSDPGALKLFDAIFNETGYFYNVNTQGSDPSTIITLPADPTWALHDAPAYESAGVPVLGNDYPVPTNLADDLRTFEFYSALGWIPSVQGATSSRDVLSNGPFMAMATATAPVVRGSTDLVNFLSGGAAVHASLTGGDRGDFFIGGPGTNTIDAGRGDDTIFAHPEIAGKDHVLELDVITGATRGASAPSVTVSINGHSAIAPVAINANWSDVAVKPQHIAIDTAAFGTIDSIQVSGDGIYYNDQGDFNNLFLMSMSYDGVPLTLAQAQLDGGAVYLADGSDILLNRGASVAFSGAAIPAPPYLADTSDTINGGAGEDTVVYRGQAADYSMMLLPDGGIEVTSRKTAEGPDVLHNVEVLQMSDASMSVRVSQDVAGIPGQAYRLYQAAFGRAPDLGGLGYQINDLQTRFTLSQVAGNFIASPEFQSKYGPSISDARFVTLLYENVLHREPDDGGLQFHLGEIAAGESRATCSRTFPNRRRTKRT
jgi:uncharacterized protein (TIGR01370 family)